MAYKKITELPEATSAVDSDLLVIETQGGTKKIKKENLVFDTTVDPVPTEGSDNAVSSGGVYDALQNKKDSPVVIEGTLLSGYDAITFTNDVFSEDVAFQIFTDNEETIITGAEIDPTNKTLTLTVEPMSVNVKIRICVN